MLLFPTAKRGIARKAANSLRIAHVNLMGFPELAPRRRWCFGEAWRLVIDAEILRADRATSPEGPRNASNTSKVRHSVTPRTAISTATAPSCAFILVSSVEFSGSLMDERADMLERWNYPTTHDVPVRRRCIGAHFRDKARLVDNPKVRVPRNMRVFVLGVMSLCLTAQVNLDYVVAPHTFAIRLLG